MVDLGAQRREALEVLVDRPHADGAAAGQRNPRVAAAGEQRPQHQHARAHGLDQLVGRVVGRAVAPAAAQSQAAVVALDAAPCPGGRAGAAWCGCRAPAARGAGSSGSSVSRLAARAGRAAFLAPLARTRPASGVGPSMWNLSMKNLEAAAGGREKGGREVVAGAGGEEWQVGRENAIGARRSAGSATSTPDRPPRPNLPPTRPASRPTTAAAGPPPRRSARPR